MDTIETPIFRSTLKVPHASDPVHSAHVTLYRVHRGPKRTTRRHLPHACLTLPALETWTLDTVRATFYDLASLIDRAEQNALYGNCIDREFTNRTRARGTVSVDDESVNLRAESDTFGALIILDNRALTPPMLDAARNLAALPPFDVAQLYQPPTSINGDDNERATLQQVRDVNRIIAKVRAVARDNDDASNKLLLSLEKLIDVAIEHLGLDDEDWKGGVR